MKRLLAIVLDAAAPELIEQWIGDNSLPSLKQLRERGAYGRLHSVAEFLAEAAPYAFFTGRNPAASGLHFYAMWDRESMQVRPPGRDWLAYEPFWRAFDSSGPRAVVLDPSNVHPPQPFNGAEIIGWATHDALAPFQSHPPELAGWVRSRFGASRRVTSGGSRPLRKSGTINHHQSRASGTSELHRNTGAYGPGVDCATPPRRGDGREHQLGEETTSLGGIHISPNAIASIAYHATLESYGVVGLAPKNFAEGVALTITREPARGVAVRFDGQDIDIDIYVIVEYGTRITSVADSVASTVRYHVETAIGMPVHEINVHVAGLRVSDEG